MIVNLPKMESFIKNNLINKEVLNVAGLDRMKLISETKLKNKIICIYELVLKNKIWHEIRIYKTDNIRYTVLKKIKI